MSLCGYSKLTLNLIDRGYRHLEKQSDHLMSLNSIDIHGALLMLSLVVLVFVFLHHVFLVLVYSIGFKSKYCC